MIEIDLQECDTYTIRSIAQHNYGQRLHVTAPLLSDGTEVDFYQSGRNITRYMTGGEVQVPDTMLLHKETITAYIYIREKDEGRTIKQINIFLRQRPAPGNNPEPDTQDHKRLLPSGGTEGDLLVKSGRSDYDTGWEACQVLTAEDLNHIFGEGEEREAC